MAKKYYKLLDGVKTELTTEEVTNLLESQTTQEARKFDNLKNSKINSLKEYLTSTDWYDIRSIKGEACPDDITSNRALARTRQDEVEACTTEEELDDINVSFEV